MIDHGLFQEREFQARNWERCPVDPSSIDVLLLTHAHLDHCGLLPRLVKHGFSGRILTTKPTVALAQLVMNDSARIQEEDVAYKKKRHRKEGRTSPYPYEPLYTRRDALAVEPLIDGVRYDEPVSLNKNVQIRFREAGHILGSSMVEIDVTENAKTQRIIFSGDIGQWDVPIVGDPTMIPRADWAVMESTYGDKDHERPKDIEDQIADVVLETLDRGGNVVVPTFAIERAQELLLYIAELVHAKRIPRVTTFLDSPMAVKATEIFRRNIEFMDDEAQRTAETRRLASAWEWINLVRATKASKAINSIRGTSIILAGSGMCTGGRIKHHLAHNIMRPESTILFVGYQAVGTLGREIVEGNEEVRIFGKMFPVKAQVRQTQGLSAHAGRSDLIHWLQGFQHAPSQLFLTHGEEETSLALAEEVRAKLGWNVSVPEYQEEVDLAPVR
jgi:metallo-beta-lactamase family protein